MGELSPYTKKLLKKNNLSLKINKKEEEATVHVDEIAMRVASFYEKVRGVIDWKGEHLLKRSAISRMLKRKMFSQINLADGKFSKESIPAEPLVIDLIRSGHFPNDKIGESKIEEIQKIIDKYIYIIKNSHFPENVSRIDFYQWLSSLAACEIEEALSPSIKERALIAHMYKSMKNSIEVENEISEEEKNILIYIAVQKALFDLDQQIISYHILKQKIKNWKKLSQEELVAVTKNIHNTKQQINKYFNHQLLKKILRVCRVYNTPYLILGDILSQNGKKAEEILEDPQKTESSIKKHYRERVSAMKSRLSRAAIYSTLSIFITNIFALLIVEIPLARLVMGSFSPLAIVVDILAPTVLMAFLVITIKSPPNKNEKKVIMETMKIIYKKDKIETFKVKQTKERKLIFKIIINFFYFLGFFASIGVIVYFLKKINFPPPSYFILIIFISLIAFAGIKIRERGKELHMIKIKDSFFRTLVDIFALPIIQMGKWITLRWEKYNVISVFFSALIDLPFMIFVEFIDQWRNFLKEKKEDIY